MSAKNKKRFLYDRLDELGLLEYGSYIEKEIVMGLLGIELPEMATYEEYQRIQIKLLQHTAHCRDLLRKEGKYLKEDRGGYRIPALSENVRFVEKYIEDGIAKINRGMELNRSTDREHRLKHTRIDRAFMAIKAAEEY